MKNFWKWFFILLGTFIVVFLLAFVAFSIFGGKHAGVWYIMPMMGRGLRFFRGGPLMPHMQLPGGFTGGFGVFGWVGMIFSWLLRLGFLALVIAGIVWVVRSLTQSKAPAAPVQYVVPAAPVPPAAPAEPVTPAQPASACAHCGKPIQVDWKLCPYCGAPLSESKQ